MYSVSMFRFNLDRCVSVRRTNCILVISEVVNLLVAFASGIVTVKKGGVV